jgi:LmbE family N-acetylglucosaminyl deacetylase
MQPRKFMPNQRILLAVLAHPDDESFGTGGTLALYAQQGAQVYLICATRGEVGEMDPKHMRGFNSIAERREDELRCAAEKLGLTKVFFLNYRDSGMPGSVDNSHPDALAFQPQEKVAAEVAHYIRLLKPQVVITFDPIGGYRHPDHIAIQKATTQAFQDAAKPEPSPDGLPPFQAGKLYYHTFPRAFLRIMVKLMPLFGQNPRQLGTNKDIDMVSIAEVNFPIHADIDFAPVARIREEASACHASQGGGGFAGSGPIGLLRRVFMSKEQYMLAYPPPRQDEKRVKDLFAGTQV